MNARHALTVTTTLHEIHAALGGELLGDPAQVIHRIAAIAQADGQSITPANAQEEADALRWSFWTVTEVEKDALTVLMHRLAMPAEQRKPDLADAAEQRLRVPCRVLEEHLKSQAKAGAHYVSGQRFTVADLCMASVLVWAKSSELLMTEFPTVKTGGEAGGVSPVGASSRKGA